MSLSINLAEMWWLKSSQVDTWERAAFPKTSPVSSREPSWCSAKGRSAPEGLLLALAQSELWYGKVISNNC